jgi:hypothetical protein
MSEDDANESQRSAWSCARRTVHRMIYAMYVGK